MLGTLARKLRALGFDTSYYGKGDDAGILWLALAEGRVLITSDRPLVERARSRGLTALLLTGKKDTNRIASLVGLAKFYGVPLTRGDSLCSICGGRLEPLRRADVSGKVPPMVVKRHRIFFRCFDCGRYYWKGSHWKKLRWLERILGEIPFGTDS